MMPEKEEVLMELGLSINEAKVYVALVRLGANTAGKIANQCKLHRTNVYDALERLQEKGLVSFITQNDTKLFEAADPKSLPKLIEERQAKLEAIMPQLLLDKQMAKSTSAHIHEGVKAFRLMIFNILNYNKPISMFGIPKHASSTTNFVDLFHKARTAKKIMMKHLYNENATERMEHLNKMPYTEAKYLPQQFNSPISTVICGDEVLFVHWDDPFTTIRIESKPLAEVYQNYFELLYHDAKFPHEIAEAGAAKARKAK
jgi:predicted transcriptional regulator